MTRSTMHSLVLVMLMGLGACAAKPVVEHTTSLDACAVEYVIAFDVPRRLVGSARCDWSKLTDQARADRIQAEIVRSNPAGGANIGYTVTKAEGGPAIGVISKGMLLPNGSAVELSTGTRLLAEGDVLVRVSSAGINQAMSIEEVAANIDSVIPSIESSDRMLPDGAPRTKPIWTATNGNARWCVVGEEVDISNLSPAHKVEMFANLKVELLDENGKSLQINSMSHNPLQSVLDLLLDMQRRGDLRLQPGDLISLGDVSRPQLPQSGAGLTAVFHGLAKPAPTVEARYQ